MKRGRSTKPKVLEFAVSLVRFWFPEVVPWAVALTTLRDENPRRDPLRRAVGRTGLGSRALGYETRVARVIGELEVRRGRQE